MWVPWRAGNTSREQAIRRARAAARRPNKARGPSKKDTAKVIAVKRRALFKQLKQGKITKKEYDRELRKLR